MTERVDFQVQSTTQYKNRMISVMSTATFDGDS